MIPRLFGAFGLVLAMATSVWAGPVTLQAQTLLERPGVVAVDPKNVTTIQFCDQILWSAFKAAWLHAAVSAQDKRVLLLDASANSGEASMHVWIEGESTPLQLLVRVSGSALANHLYFVSCTHAAASAAAPNSAATAAAPEVTTRPAVSPVGSEVITPRTVENLAPATRPASGGGTAARNVPGGEALESASGLPAWAAWQASATTTLAGRIISYNLTNTGSTTLVLDAARLRVVGANGASVSGVSLSRRSTSGFDGRVSPGQAESGVIWIPTVPTGDVTLRWPVVEIGTSVTYTITQRVPQ